MPQFFVSHRNACKLSHIEAMVRMVDNGMSSNMYRRYRFPLTKEYGFVVTCNMFSIMCKREPPHVSHVMIHWPCKRTHLQRSLVMHDEASVLHPIFQTTFLYLASNWNRKFCFYASFGPFRFLATLGSLCEGLI